MSPKKTTEPPLNEAEKELLRVAARVFAALEYKERHVHMDDTNFASNLMEEAVRHKIYILLLCSV